MVAYLRAVMAAQVEAEPEVTPEPPKGLARFLRRKQGNTGNTRMITPDEPAAKAEPAKPGPRPAGPVVVRTASPESPAEAAEPASQAAQGQAGVVRGDVPKEAAAVEAPREEARRAEPDAARASVSGAEAVRQAMEMTAAPAPASAEAEAATEIQEALTWEVFTARTPAMPEMITKAVAEAAQTRPAAEPARTETVSGEAKQAAAAKRGEVLPPRGASAERGRGEAGRPGPGRVITMEPGTKPASGETPAS